MARNSRDEGVNTYTQTYSTADREVKAATATAVGDIGATNGGWGCDSEVHMDSIHTAIDALIADVLQLKKVVTALIDDLQTQGLIN